MSLRKTWVAGVLAAGLCSGMAAGQEQKTPPVQQVRDASEPALPLPRDEHSAVIEGACDVSLVVDKAGRPQKIHVVHCTDKRLKEYAEFSVSGYKFIPAKQNGHPVSAQTTIEISVHKPAKDAVADTVSRDAAETSADGVGMGPVLPEGVYQVGGDVTAPALIHSQTAPWPRHSNGMPEMPRDIQDKPITVKVWANVGTDGLVHEAGILQSKYPEFEENALGAVELYRFKPAMKGGQPVAVRITVMVSFTRNPMN